MDSSDETLFGELLQRFRKRKGLTQQELADRIGAYRSTISFWERGFYRPETLATLHELVRVLDLDEEEKRLFFEAHIGTASILPFSNLPAERNPYFTGREEVLDALHQKLSGGKYVALTQAISGLGGIGKTQIALEYAYRYRNSYHDILWTSADTHAALVASYETLARRLRLRERDERDPSKVVAALKRWLAEHKGWLLVLDNVEELSLVNRFVPPDRQGAVVLTTRRQVTEPVAQAIEVDALAEEDGALFLLKRTRRLTLEGSLANASTEDVTVAQSIVRQLGGLPLALDQAGAYVLETGCSLGAYLELLRHRQQMLLQRRGTVPTDHPQSVAMTFTLAFERVQQRSEAAHELLRFCAFLAPDAIAEELLSVRADTPEPFFHHNSADPLALNEALEVLCTFSLTRRHSESKTISMHRLVQAVVKDGLHEQERQHWLTHVIEVLNAAFPEAKPETWGQCQRFVPHVLVCAPLTEGWEIPPPALASLLYKAACYLYDQAHYAEAEPLFQRAWRIWEQALGPDHPQVAYPLNGLANLYRKQGKREEAEPLFQRACHIWEQALGLDHPQVAQSLHNLAELYLEQGRYAEAEPLFQRACRIWEQALGPDHPQVAYALYGLAVLNDKRGKYEEAEPLFHRVQHIWEQAFGPDHPQVAQSLYGLAVLYSKQGKYEEAEPLFQRSRGIWEQAFGSDHPQVAQSLYGLAILYYEQSRDEEAEPLFQRACRIWEQTFGPDHREVAYALYGLAILYKKQGRYEEAEPLFHRVQHIWEQAFGPGHPQVAYLLHILAELSLEQTKYEQAESFYERALHIWEQTLGLQCPEAASSLNGLANLYRERGRYIEAEQLYQRALAIRERQLGLEHPDTAETWHDFAVLQSLQGNLAKAEPLYRQALAVREQRLGRQHPKTRATLKYHVALLRKAGRPDEAAALEARFAGDHSKPAAY